ncbi:D-ribose-binding periplasmic protein [uncultured Pleomorphomonas sp.]|uniref:D-ribose-binding periplasmic protein n=1 Tax=uncultured Pleomorphomonas sp. TaxID=442121 RepID=A0A212LE40_9HYPH|nr:sugar ABC transporter substrate-binding protein [uncultured Pleomorphomonas sp.]SCM75811.1 D-ribose-binding periplasmic protein [uncultured Pleomorphomonas sp.]
MTKKMLAAIAAVLLSFTVSAPGASAADVKIAAVLKTLSTPYWQILGKAIKDAGAKSNVDLVLLGPPTEDAVEQQINMVQDAISQQPDALIFAPSQPAAAVNVLLKAKEAGIPVILVDTGMPDGFEDYVTYIGTDNFAAGKMGGEALAALLKKGDKALLLDGTPGNPSMNRRIDGAAEVLEAAGIVVAARLPAFSDREKAYSATQAALQSNPDLAGVFSGSDEQALGSMRALKQSGKTVPVIAVDGDNDAVKAILAGDMYGTIAQGNYKMGQLAVEKALDTIAGKPVEKRIDSGTTLITKDNAQEFLDFKASLLQ